VSFVEVGAVKAILYWGA